MYKPAQFGGGDQQALVAWMERELLAIQASFFDLDSIRLRETNVAPTKPRAGDVYFADGTNWNPGAGAGFYGYYGGAWNKLG